MLKINRYRAFNEEDTIDHNHERFHIWADDGREIDVTVPVLWGTITGPGKVKEKIPQYLFGSLTINLNTTLLRKHRIVAILEAVHNLV